MINELYVSGYCCFGTYIRHIYIYIYIYMVCVYVTSIFVFVCLGDDDMCGNIVTMYKKTHI